MPKLPEAFTTPGAERSAGFGPAGAGAISAASLGRWGGSGTFMACGPGAGMAGGEAPTMLGMAGAWATCGSGAGIWRSAAAGRAGGIGASAIGAGGPATSTGGMPPGGTKLWAGPIGWGDIRAAISGEDGGAGASPGSGPDGSPAGAVARTPGGMKNPPFGSR